MMRILHKIGKSKKTALLVLFFYSLLYICVIFHFHPLSLNHSQSHEIVQPTEENSIQQLNYQCEVCHVSNTFNQLPSQSLAEEKLNLPFYELVITQSFSLHKYSGLSSQLRAPPLV